MKNYKLSNKTYKQSIKKNKSNKSLLSRILTVSKSFLANVNKKNYKLANQLFNKTQSLISKAVLKNVLKTNKASRKIRNLYNNGPATNISNIENIKVVYEKNDNSIFNLKTITESVFQSFSRDGRGLLNIQKEHLTDLSDVSYNSLELTNKQLLQLDLYMEQTEMFLDNYSNLPLAL